MDWKKLIENLISKGLSQADIAERCSCGQSTISQISTGVRGKRVSFDVGQSLITLHKEIVGDL